MGFGFLKELLRDEAGKLINAQEGKTRALRQWRFKSLNEIDPGLVSKYIDESKKHQLAGNIIKPTKKPLIVPSELTSALNKYKLSDKFESYSLTHKREFTDYITEASGKKPS